MSEEPDVDIGDPYSELVPVLAGITLTDDPVQLDAKMELEEVYSEDRNLWTLVIDGNEIVTFDANHFPTTTDLGDYIADVREGYELGLKAEAGELDEDPRRLGDEEGPAFQ